MFILSANTTLLKCKTELTPFGACKIVLVKPIDIIQAGQSQIILQSVLYEARNFAHSNKLFQITSTVEKLGDLQHGRSGQFIAHRYFWDESDSPKVANNVVAFLTLVAGMPGRLGYYLP